MNVARRELGSLAIAKRFVSAINSHQTARIFGLMTDDHVFVDSLGSRVGRPQIEEGWRVYLAVVPDYRIRVESAIETERVAVLFGTAEGSYVPQGGARRVGHWSTPCAWRAVAALQKLSEWRVYSDNEPIRALMRKAPPEGPRAPLRSDRSRRSRDARII